jgi:quinol monooxygenase YgiN
MNQKAMTERTLGDVVSGGGLLVVAQWQVKEGHADVVADILRRYLPHAQSEPGVKMFLISRGKDDPAHFLFYELFADEAAFAAHQAGAHFKALIVEQALPLLSKRERTQYALL